MSAKSEIRFKTYNTRRNFPPQSGRRRSESNFVGAFLRSYMRDDKGGYWCGRHFAVPDCGVADCIVFRLGAKDDEMAMEHLTAFEAKLSDWRKALAQAYRYRYYADSSVVIMPRDRARSAVDNGNLFERSGIGLWTFDHASGAIQKVIPTRSLTPRSAEKREQALIRIHRCALQLRKFRKDAETF
jgi:hypothetical protein